MTKMFENSAFKTPPKTPPQNVLTLQIGITGHRNINDAQKEIISKKAEYILGIIEKNILRIYKREASLYLKNKPPVLRIISPLAEGADRMIVEKALSMQHEGVNFSFQCPLPFNADEYEKDFISEESKKQFRKLLNMAETVLELDGSRKRQQEAYLSAGKLVLEQSDILIAMWNGEHPKLIGGTSHIVHEAVKRGIPVIWINSEAPYDVTYGIDKNKLSWETEIEKRLDEIFSPFEEIGEKESKDFQTSAETYLNEKQKRWNFAFAYQLLINMVGRKKFKLPQIRVEEYETLQQKAWVEELNGIKDETQGSFTEDMENASLHYCKHYAWADMLSIHYGNLYRTSYIIRYLFSAFAVIAVALGFYGGTVLTNFLGFLFQGVFLGAIIFLAQFEHKRGWQKRFLDYRILAEIIRQMRFLAPLGLVTPLIKVPVYSKNKSITWINWHFRSIAREKGLANLKIDDEYLGSYYKLFKKVAVDSEKNFYESRSEEFSNISNRLGKIGMFIFKIGFCAVLIRAVPFIYKLYYGDTDGVKAAIKFLNELSLIIPGFAPFFFSIKSQGEFERVSRRYRAMYERLQDMSKELEESGSSEINIMEDIAKDFSSVMVREVSDWFELINAKSISYI